MLQDTMYISLDRHLDARIMRFFLLLCRGAIRGEDVGDDDDDGEEVNRWNLRKCSAAGLDVLSTVFGDELLPIVLPIVEQRLRVCTTICCNLVVKLHLVQSDVISELSVIRA